MVHLAGFKYAGESVARPLHTYAQNVEGTRLLLEAMADQGVGRIVFSSSAATYGTPDVDVVTEATPTTPESPYGESKLIGEWLLRDQARAVPLQHTSLRYFNVVGSAHDEVYDSSPHNLFPLVLKALTDGRTPRINGDDYATPDGTCVRDYVHVGDLADAHVAAARALVDGRDARAGVQPRQRRRGLGPPDHGGGGPGDRHAVRAGGRAPAPGRPGPDRRLRRAGLRRPGLDDAPHPRRDGRVRLAVVAERRGHGRPDPAGPVPRRHAGQSSRPSARAASSRPLMRHCCRRTPGSDREGASQPVGEELQLGALLHELRVLEGAQQALATPHDRAAVHVEHRRCVRVARQHVLDEGGERHVAVGADRELAARVHRWTGT